MKIKRTEKTPNSSFVNELVYKGNKKKEIALIKIYPTI
jgi:hypothetical protein